MPDSTARPQYSAVLNGGYRGKATLTLAHSLAPKTETSLDIELKRKTRRKQRRPHAQSLASALSTAAVKQDRPEGHRSSRSTTGRPATIITTPCKTTSSKRNSGFASPILWGWMCSSSCALHFCLNGCSSCNNACNLCPVYVRNAPR